MVCRAGESAPPPTLFFKTKKNLEAINIKNKNLSLLIIFSSLQTLFYVIQYADKQYGSNVVDLVLLIVF